MIVFILNTSVNPPVDVLNFFNFLAMFSPKHVLPGWRRPPGDTPASRRWWPFARGITVTATTSVVTTTPPPLILLLLLPPPHHHRRRYGTALATTKQYAQLILMCSHAEGEANNVSIIFLYYFITPLTSRIYRHRHRRSYNIVII